MIGSANFSTWFPQAASTHARGVDGLYYGIYVAAVFVLILFAGLALAYFYQFRRQDPEGKGEAGRRLNPFLLGVWVLGAVGLGLFAYVGGIPGFVDQTVAPYGAYRIHANARPGGWDFTYPNGSAADTLRVRAGQPVQLSLTSADPGYSLTIPALRINQAILPGHDNRTWFTVDVPGEFPLRSNVFNGADHDSTATALVALSEQDFDTWLATISDIFIGRTLPEVGELLYNRLGCKACHTTNGAKLVGPSFKDLYGFEFDTVQGVRITVDDAYVRESILTPNVSVVAGYQPVMTPFAGLVTDREIEAITAWLKTLSSKGGVEETGPAPDTEPGVETGQEEN